MTPLAGDMSETYGGGDGVSMLQKLDRKEILEVLSEEGLFCQHCESVLQSRIINLLEKKFSKVSLSNSNSGNSVSTDASTLSSSKNSMDSSPTMSRPRGYAAVATSSPASVNNKQYLSKAPETSLNGGLNEEENERTKFLQVGRKKDFVHIERIGGKQTNVLQGLELHSHVFNAEEQKNIVECVYNFQRMGQKGQLRERTYSEPRKWMRGKGRVTMQFGCCYNYSVDKNGNPPGIVRDEEVDPLPPLFKQMIKRMVRWHVLPSTCVPNSCIVNIYDEGDCIPPHIDHHDFLRPFCTVSFLTECKILFGSSLKVVDAGEFSGPISIPLPLGSVLILNGNGADVAKHCIPAVPSRRYAFHLAIKISITFRKMDDSKMPFKFLPDPDLLGIKPLILSSAVVAAPKLPVQQVRQIQQHLHKNNDINKESSSSGVKETMTTSRNNNNNNSSFKNNDFPPLGSSRSYSWNRQQQPRADRRVG